MSDSESPGSPAGSAESPLLEPLPLGKGQRLAATAVGTALTGSGIASVFLGENQIGSGVLLLAGAAFLLIAVSGMPILGARFQDFELRWAWRWRRTALHVATRLPSDEARRLLEVIDAVDPGSDPDPLLTLIDSLLFEARVKDAVIAALDEGERIEPHPTAGIGEPLIDWVSRERDTRIGVFAMSPPSGTGRISTEFTDRFLRQLPRSGCAAMIMITCIRDHEDLAALAARIQRESGPPVVIVEWEPSGDDQPPRPVLESLMLRACTATAGPPRQRVSGTEETGARQ